MRHKRASIPLQGCLAGCTHGEAYCSTGKRLLAEAERFHGLFPEGCFQWTAKEHALNERYWRAMRAYLHHIGVRA